jgi:alcohol dehydrogenase (cytochrome c)
MMTTGLLGGCAGPGAVQDRAAVIGPAMPRAADALAGYKPVTDARLTSPEPQNWLMYRRTYDSWVYSPLAQITASNVKDLVPVWSVATGVVEGHQAPPIVNDGIMFVTTPQNQVLSLDGQDRRSPVAVQAGAA